MMKRHEDVNPIRTGFHAQYVGKDNRKKCLV